MLVEIPDPEVILGVITAFVIGILVLFIYSKLKSYVNLKPKTQDPGHMERLEYYERQLIDMKIRLDALDIADLGTKSADLPEEVKEMEQKVVIEPKRASTPKKVEIFEGVSEERMPNLGYGDAISHVLRLITNKSMTSRDIQITIGRTREHTSRLMKKLFEDGFVERNTNTKPFTYSITEKGREKLGLLGSVPTTV
jgi:predicted transcriptional regulator